ncbi:hypothetical protein GTW43_24125 [Streptomyces sp. SID5785]|uniref:hypothetical protein n=1 Tax=Streptomyces sp. SID5785 TaxID=2690309 RepID=UPI0013615EF0|nr:hypothetical protein [Streptomyces sp. SID5785]
MRLSRPTVTVLAVLALLGAGTESVAAPEPSGAGCRVRIVGSDAVATCHNPYPAVDRVALHVECAQWWDIDRDTKPRAVGPAETVRIAGRCWKDVRSAWVSHRQAG